MAGNLNRADYDMITYLQMQCLQKDQITLKLELDYKLADAENSSYGTDSHDLNEFMYFNGEQLIGYIGICAFGGPAAPIEITGMVHPRFRRRGIFMKLYEMAITECKRRKASSILALCDQKSVTGQKFLEKIGAVYKYSEFEMFLLDKSWAINNQSPVGVTLRKATNADASEVARQNAIYFRDSVENINNDILDQEMLLPEDEEKRGMTIYLVEKDKQVIGKVHFILENGVGGIYGLGVLPDQRGKGLGRKILHLAINKLIEAKTREIMLQVAAGNTAALSLYKSCGFRETSVMDYFELTL